MKQVIKTPYYHSMKCQYSQKLGNKCGCFALMAEELMRPKVNILQAIENVVTFLQSLDIEVMDE